MAEILSPYLIAAAVAWLLSQGAKYVVASIRARSWRQLRHLYLSGNMPSAHSATVVAVTTVIGLIDGFGSGLFALALLFAFVVMYDAMMVRRSSGEQGTILLQLLKDTKSQLLPPRVALGHKPLEVVVGALLGVLVGIGSYLLLVN